MLKLVNAEWKTISRSVSDNTNIEFTANIHILLEKPLENSTEQEQKIITLLSEGYNRSEIAQRLSISQSTVVKSVIVHQNKDKSLDVHFDMNGDFGNSTIIILEPMFEPVM